MFTVYDIITQYIVSPVCLYKSENLKKTALFIPENDGLDLVKTLSSHLLRGPYCNGSTTATSLPTVTSPRQCLSLSNLLPSALLYFEPLTMTNEVQRLLDTASLLGEDEIVKLTNTLCQGLKEPTIFHREFYVSHDTFEEEVYFNDAAVTIVTCRLNPAVHTGYVSELFQKFFD